MNPSSSRELSAGLLAYGPPVGHEHVFDPERKAIVHFPGHLMFYAPDGESIVTAAGTPSDHRALANLLSRLRHHGFVWKGR